MFDVKHAYRKIFDHMEVKNDVKSTIFITYIHFASDKSKESLCTREAADIDTKYGKKM